MVFKWAVIDGLEEKRTFWGPARAGAAEPEPPPSKRHSLAPLPCLVFGSLVFLLHSFPLPLPPSVKESHIPYILALGLRPSPLCRLHTPESLSRRRTWGKLRSVDGALKKEQKAKRGEGVSPEGLTDMVPIQKLTFFLLIANVAVNETTEPLFLETGL